MQLVVLEPHVQRLYEHQADAPTVDEAVIAVAYRVNDPKGRVVVVVEVIEVLAALDEQLEWTYDTAAQFAERQRRDQPRCPALGLGGDVSGTGKGAAGARFMYWPSSARNGANRYCMNA